MQHRPGPGHGRGRGLWGKVPPYHGNRVGVGSAWGQGECFGERACYLEYSLVAPSGV